MAEIDRPDITVQEVADNAWCQGCGARGAKRFTITFEDGSFDAMQGAGGDR